MIIKIIIFYGFKSGLNEELKRSDNYDNDFFYSQKDFFYYSSAMLGSLKKVK